MQGAIAVDDIDGSFVPRPRDDVVVIKAGSEIVLTRGMPFVLNPTAAVVWQCFDGDVTLDELIAEISDVTRTEEETIRSDVLALTRNFATLGLLDGVGPGSVPSSAPPVGIRGAEVGVKLESFVLTDPEGHETTWESFRGGPVLLVNWSRGCGFCTQIANELAALQEPLQEHGISLVFLAGGDAEGNRAALAEHGIEAPVFASDGHDPFGACGTPAAYLVDGEGNVNRPFALGASEVPVLAREAAGVNGETTRAGPSGVQYLPAAAAVCGGGAPGPPTSGTDWAGRAAYRFGEFHIGLRHNDLTSAQMLDDLFPGARLDDPRAPDNYSVALYGSGGRKQELNLLVKGAQQLVRSRSRARVLRGLLNHLSADLTPVESSLLRLRTSAVVRDGRATVLPFDVTGWLKDLQPRLNKSGIQVVDIPWVLIDPTAAEMVVPEPSVDYDRLVLEELGKTDKLGPELPAVLPGRYALRSWILGATAGDTRPLSPARQVGEAVALLTVPHEDLEAAGQALIGLFMHVEPIGALPEDPPTLARLLQQAG